MGGLDGYPAAWMIFCFGSVCPLKGWVHFVKTKLMICFLTYASYLLIRYTLIHVLVRSNFLRDMLYASLFSRSHQINRIHS